MAELRQVLPVSQSCSCEPDLGSDQEVRETRHRNRTPLAVAAAFAPPGCLRREPNLFLVVVAAPLGASSDTRSLRASAERRDYATQAATTELPMFHISINDDRGALCGSADLRGLVAPRLKDVLGDLMCPACCAVLVTCEPPPPLQAAISDPFASSGTLRSPS